MVHAKHRANIALSEMSFLCQRIKENQSNKVCLQLVCFCFTNTGIGSSADGSSTVSAGSHFQRPVLSVLEGKDLRLDRVGDLLL